MARDSTRAESASTKPRRTPVSLDPNRSSTRRVVGRRNLVTRPSVVPGRSEPPSAPRNRRVARTVRPSERTGPRLSTRVGLSLFAAASALTRSVTERARSVSRLGERVLGGARGFLRVLVVCGFIVGAFLLARFLQQHLTTAKAFAVDRIDVVGAARLDRSEVLDAAGLDLGVNVFTRAPEDVQARLLRHPWIIAADVQRRLPSRFEISVQEREPVALLVVQACASPLARTDEESPCDEGSSLYLVSNDAKMFKRLSGRDPVDLPVITGVTRERLAGDPEFSRRVLTDAVALLEEYRNSGLFQRFAIGEVHLERNDGFSLYVGDDLTYVRLGAPPFADKLLRMKRVFERLAREDAEAEYIYLDNEQRPDRVTVRLR